ncbi:MAG: signal peptidase I [Calditrichaeota bacterium]|nr:MAG: signal peptidase I [Calditrichota bacterium]
MNVRRNAHARQKDPKQNVQVDSGAAKKPKTKKNAYRETVEAVLIALLAAMFLRAFVVQAFRIPTGSMKDTLLVGDFLLVNKFIYGVRTPDHIPILNARIPFFRLPAFKKPHNGDVVVFKYPKDESLDYIKRCIAVGGQTVEVRNGDVYIDGKPEGKKINLGRKYDPEEGREVEYTKIISPYGKTYVIRHFVDAYARTENFGPVTVPEGHYFMMGDNRDNSSDSRVWGFLPEQNVVGEALVIYFSWNKNSAFWNLAESVRWSRIASLIH